MTVGMSHEQRRQRLHQASFSDISDETGIPRGNFYYYFKTKEDILAAVVDTRLDIFRQMLESCNAASSDPRERLLIFAGAQVRLSDWYTEFGINEAATSGYFAIIVYICV